MKKWMLIAMLFSFASFGAWGEVGASQKGEVSSSVSVVEADSQKATSKELSKEQTKAPSKEIDSENSPWIPASQDSLATTTPSRSRKALTTIKNLFFFGVVLIALFLLFRLLKKVSLPKGVGEELIQILSTKQLVGNRYLHVVRLGEEFFLVSSAEGNVNLIKKIESKELITELQLYKEKNAQPDQKNFIDRFRAMLKSERGELSTMENITQTIKNIKNRTNKMKKM